MQRVLEFIQHHPFLNGAALALLAALAVDEGLRRLRKFREIGPAESVLLINKGAAVLDLRAQGEFKAGHIINARNIPFAELDGRATELDKLKDESLVLACTSGSDAAAAAVRLGKLGFQKLFVLKGGIVAWKQDHFPLEKG
ncbi:MAG: rhodanese-like domain-containing protein [Bacillota bacterium]